MMRFSRHSGNPNIGVFAAANENLALISADASPEFERAVGEALGVKTIKTTVAGAHVIGSLVAMNSNCAVVSGLADSREAEVIEACVPCVLLDDSLNAAGNNILVNDYGAIVSPEYGHGVAAKLSEALGVEVVFSSIAGCNTVGSVCRVLCPARPSSMSAMKRAAHSSRSRPSGPRSTTAPAWSGPV